jgi:hypothetical protein
MRLAGPELVDWALLRRARLLRSPSRASKIRLAGSGSLSLSRTTLTPLSEVLASAKAAADCERMNAVTISDHVGGATYRLALMINNIREPTFFA